MLNKKQQVIDDKYGGIIVICILKMLNDFILYKPFFDDTMKNKPNILMSIILRQIFFKAKSKYIGNITAFAVIIVTKFVPQVDLFLIFICERGKKIHKLKLSQISIVTCPYKKMDLLKTHKINLRKMVPYVCLLIFTAFSLKVQFFQVLMITERCIDLSTSIKKKLINTI